MTVFTISRKNRIAGFAWILFLVLCAVSAFAEAPAADAETNLAEHGLSPDEILMEQIGFIPEENTVRIPESLEGRPVYLWFDVTEDGCVDLCRGSMFGSGMVRIDLLVYDPVSQEKYILDGYNYDFLLDSITDGRLIVIKSGPNGYGDPVTEIRGTVILDNSWLVFVADPEPVSPDGDDRFDPSQAAVSADQAVRTASAFAREYLDAGYYDEITVDHMGLGGSSDTEYFCWLISFYRYGKQEYIVYVNAETGEVENSFTVDEGVG